MHAPRVVRPTASVIATATLAFAASTVEARDLSFGERVRVQEAIERTYHSHLVGTPPPFKVAFPRSVLAAKVTRTLRLSMALDSFWHAPVTAEALRAERERIERDTRMPERLRELYAALDHDTFLFEECVARASLVERLARSFRGSEDWDAWWPSVEPTLDPARARAVSLGGPTLGFGSDPCPAPDTWDPGGLDDAPMARAEHVAVWTGTHMIVWGGGKPYTTSAFGFGRRYDPLTDTWSGISSAGEPEARRGASVVWTGTEMIVWGGTNQGGGALGTGGRHNPSTDTWSSIATTGAPTARRYHTAVWTGSRMIVWGGDHDDGAAFGDGASYDPGTDVWTAISNANAPAARRRHTAVWSGSVMVVWGGRDSGNVDLATGGRYDPATNGWSGVKTSGAPSARWGFPPVWTGSVMVIWGGVSGSATYPTDGARYDPATDNWNSVSTLNAPEVRTDHSAIWTGSEIVFWGGNSQLLNPNERNDGGRYNPVGNSWTSLTSANAAAGRYRHTAVWDGARMIVHGGFTRPSPFSESDGRGGRWDLASDTWTPVSLGPQDVGRSQQVAVWTGNEMIVWGGDADPQGSRGTGSRWNPILNTWTPVTTAGAPFARLGATAVWTGTKMIVWGGWYNTFSSELSDGGRYDPSTNSWLATTTVGAPSARYRHTAVWTGSDMIVWGGSASGASVNTGARYNLASGGWTPLPTSGAPTARVDHVAVWTGTRMIVWSGSQTNTGAVYNPAANAWSATSTSGAPSGRSLATAVWDGREMIVWGGIGASGYVSNGGRYDPAADSWLSTSFNAPAARASHTAAWTGSEMMVWGGSTGLGDLASGGLYDPAADAWRATTLFEAPIKRLGHSFLWTGDYVLVWTGRDFRDGSRYVLDTDRDGTANVCDVDDDGDGVVDASDCAPWDASLASSASEVAGMHLSKGSGTHLDWDSQGTAARYDVVTGSLSALVTSGGFSGASCLADDLPAAAWDDSTADPTAGNGYYYLVRAQNTCGTGTWGSGSSGPRQVTACP